MRCPTPYALHSPTTVSKLANRCSDRYAFQHIFARLCEVHGIAHCLAKIRHPWTNGPGERTNRTNRTIKKAPVKRLDDVDQVQLRQ